MPEVIGGELIAAIMALIVMLGVGSMAGETAPMKHVGIRVADRTQLWNRDEKTVLSGFGNMYNLDIVYEPGSKYPYKGWFFGWADKDCNRGIPGFKSCDAIFHARAKTLDQWEVYSAGGEWDMTMTASRWRPVVSAQDKIYDSWHNGDPSVVKHDGMYYMAYSSTGYEDNKKHPDGPTDDLKYMYCIMGAVSRDGIHWTRSAAPVLVHGPDYSAPERGAFAGRLHGMYHRPSIMFDGGKWKCWFDYNSGRSLAMGYAECDADAFLDPPSWKVLAGGKYPLLEEWPNPDVVKVGKKYYAYSDPGGYPATGWAARQVAEAVSDDGIRWDVLGFIRPDSDTPANHVPEAFVMEKNGKSKIILFYACQIGGDPYDYRYNRIRYMWRYE